MNETIPDPAVFRAAADVIRENGWYQGDYYERVPWTPSQNCPVCLIGALRIVTAGVPTGLVGGTVGAQLWLADLMQSASGDFITIPMWNDTPGRTVDEVLSMLDRAAVAAESARAEAAQDGGEGCG